MNRLYLADLAGESEEGIKEHIANNYANKHPKDDADRVREVLKKYSVLVAYESFGRFGCDSNSFFILQNKRTKVFATFCGSHSSCCGFEGQFDLEEMPNQYFHKLKYIFGGHDDDVAKNEALTKSWIKNNIPEGE